MKKEEDERISRGSGLGIPIDSQWDLFKRLSKDNRMSLGEGNPDEPPKLPLTEITRDFRVDYQQNSINPADPSNKFSFGSVKANENENGKKDSAFMMMDVQSPFGNKPVKEDFGKSSTLTNEKEQMGDCPFPLQKTELGPKPNMLVNVPLKHDFQKPEQPNPDQIVPDVDQQEMKKVCNCEKSKCLKLYCECFAAGQYCEGCNCIECYNIEKYENERQEALKQIALKNPIGFQRHMDVVKEQALTTGCSCTKSKCKKNYCECFKAGIECTAVCTCIKCRNNSNIKPKKKTPKK